MDDLEDAEIGFELNRGISIRYHTPKTCVTHPELDSCLVDMLKDLRDPRFLIIIVSDLLQDPLLAQAKQFRQFCLQDPTRLYTCQSTSLRDGETYVFNCSTHLVSPSLLACQPSSAFATVSNCAPVDAILRSTASMLSFTPWGDCQWVSELENSDKPFLSG